MGKKKTIKVVNEYEIIPELNGGEPMPAVKSEQKMNINDLINHIGESLEDKNCIVKLSNGETEWKIYVDPKEYHNLINIFQMLFQTISYDLKITDIKSGRVKTIEHDPMF